MREKTVTALLQKRLLFLCLFAIFATRTTAAQDLTLTLDANHTAINFTLNDVLHTVHGTFQLRQSKLRFDPAAGKFSGEIAVDAKSGQTGNGMRDRKMHREVLESERYPEILFRPDRTDGAVPLQGKSSVKVHGIFNIHGADHELTIPAEVEILPDHWKATFHFAVPYTNWGMKNPSTLFLRVSDTVDVDVVASGTLEERSN